MPSVFGKEAKKKELIKNLDQLYGQIQREHQVCLRNSLARKYPEMILLLLTDLFRRLSRLKADAGAANTSGFY